ncbi:phosphatase [Bacillus cereus]|uniref:Phosphatase n=1 Tax=Bacillus cereus TaxID=1396 RepID=A0A2B0U6K3_BACCE|nr:phosphatase [Bacillus cereus]PFL24893.1 phosphatase [Bacillus cereus]PFU42061.1 phosphatase [Bacillus cereus]
MERMKILNVNFADMTAIPFFQVEAKNRIRFDIELFEGNLRGLRGILTELFKSPDTIDVSFISGYITYGKSKRINEKTKIGRFMKIKNWTETKVDVDDLESTIIFTTIKGVHEDEVYKYCKYVVNGGQQAYISFYNDTYLLYISTDVIDIISPDTSLIEKLKLQYSEEYDKFYETILTDSEMFTSDK